jgi:hypothetical protein
MFTHDTHEGTKHALLRDPHVEGQCGGCVIAYLHHLGMTHQEVQDPVSEGCVQSQGPELSGEEGTMVLNSMNSILTFVQVVECSVECNKDCGICWDGMQILVDPGCLG